MSTTPSAGQLRSLTGLRWVAALLVFAYHVHVIQYFGDGVARQVVDHAFSAGNTGVSFFFILSGFVLAWSAREGDRARAFWRRRLARVYPVHLAAAAIAAVLLWWQSPQLLPPARVLVANLLLIHSWRIDPAFTQSLDPVSWSLACEAFFYALFPLMFAVLRRAGRRALWTVSAGSVLVVFAVPLVVSRQAAYFLPAARLAEFVLGMALAGLVRQGGLRRLRFLPAVLATLTGYALACVVADAHRYAACTVVGFALLIAAAAAADLDDRPCLLRHRWMVRLGELSFAFYMIHILVTRLAEVVLPHRPNLPTLPALAVSVTLFAISLGCAWLLYEWIERPGRQAVLAAPGLFARLRPPRGTAVGTTRATAGTAAAADGTGRVEAAEPPQAQLVTAGAAQRSSSSSASPGTPASPSGDKPPNSPYA